MIFITGISIAIRLLALIWSIVLLRRIKDWRVGFLTVMFALMAIRQLLTLGNMPSSALTDLSLASSELPGLIVSIMAFLSILSLEKLLTAPKKAEASLNEMNQRFQQLTDNLEEIFWITSIDGNQVIYVSPAYETIFQRKAADLYANPKSWLSFIVPEDQPKVIEAFQEEVLVRSLFNVEYRMKRPDGSIRWIKAKGFPVKNRLGETYRIAGVASDITRQKLTEIALKNSQSELEKRVEERTFELRRANENLKSEMMQRQQSVQALEESEEKFRQIAENVEEVFWMEDIESSQLIYISPAFEKIWGLPLEELTKNPKLWMESIHPEDRQKIEDLNLYKNREILFKGQHKAKFRIVQPDGSIRWILDQAFPVCNSKGKAIRIVGISQDITELKSAMEKAEQANRAKSEFLSHMSHELRTPLNAILGFAQLLGLDKRNTMEPKQKESIEQIRVAGNHLLELINEVLDLTRIEAGSLNVFMENTDVSRLLKKLLPVVESQAEKKNVHIFNHISKNGPLYVFADPTRLKQALINLITNAIKYNLDGGEVHIKSETEDNKIIRIHVIDTGPGIEPDKHESIFEPFERLGAEQFGIEGTGIGLTITKKLLGLMNGRVFMKSELGKGSCFTIELQAEDTYGTLPKIPSGRKTNPQLKSNEVSGYHSVLCIEDNPSNLRLVKKYIEDHTSLNFMSSQNPVEGIDLAKQYQPSLILMDINLPEMDGIAAFRELQKLEATKSIPVIAISANAMDHDIQKALDAGFKNYITKPLDLDQLVNAIHENLNTSAL